MEGNAHRSTNFPILPSVFGGREFRSTAARIIQKNLKESRRGRGPVLVFELISEAIPT